jgi:hypothetical protein
MSEHKEGWGFPAMSNKAHYFVNGMSLCNRWGFYRGPLEQGNDDSLSNCKECVRRLKKKKEAK